MCGDLCGTYEPFMCGDLCGTYEPFMCGDECKLFMCSGVEARQLRCSVAA